MPLDSVRQSTLECFYNQSCIDQFVSSSTRNIPLKALNLSRTRFPLNMSIGVMFDQSLFVESWGNSSNFEEYFDVCQVNSLSYSYQQRCHLSWMLTTLISAFGGLMIIWQFFIPLFIRIAHKLRTKSVQIEEVR